MLLVSTIKLGPTLLRAHDLRLTPQEWRRFWRIILVQVLVGLGLLALLIWYVHQGNDLGIIRQFVG
jgi:hypothetical protein